MNTDLWAISGLILLSALVLTFSIAPLLEATMDQRLDGLNRFTGHLDQAHGVIK